MKQMKNRITALIIFLILCYTTQAQDTTRGGIYNFPEEKEQQDDRDTLTQDEKNIRLILAADSGHSDKVLRLLKMGADVNTTTYNNVTPLMYAAQNGHFLTTKILIVNGANLEMSPWDGATALIAATKANHRDIVELLIRKGANYNTGDAYRVTPLMYAAGYGYYTLTSMLLYYEADISAKDEDGNTALMGAVYYQHYPVAILLIDSGANVNSTDSHGNTPLIVASGMGDTTMMKILLENGADVNIRNNDGYTAIATAVDNKNTAAVEILLKAGANVNPKKQKPLTIATLNRDKFMHKLLKKHGARHSIFPGIHKLKIVYGMDMNFQDNFNNLQFGCADFKYNLELSVGFGLRYWAKRIWVDAGDNLFYQYWERRFYWHADIIKGFVFKTNGNKKQSVYLGMRNLYTFGNYRGADTKPEAQYIPVPEIGYMFYGRHAGLKVGYQYMDMGFYKIHPHRIGFHINFYIPLGKYAKTYKIIRWL